MRLSIFSSLSVIVLASVQLATAAPIPVKQADGLVSRSHNVYREGRALPALAPRHGHGQGKGNGKGKPKKEKCGTPAPPSTTGTPVTPPVTPPGAPGNGTETPPITPPEGPPVVPGAPTPPTGANPGDSNIPPPPPPPANNGAGTGPGDGTVPPPPPPINNSTGPGDNPGNPPPPPTNNAGNSTVVDCPCAQNGGGAPGAPGPLPLPGAPSPTDGNPPTPTGTGVVAPVDGTQVPPSTVSPAVIPKGQKGPGRAVGNAPAKRRVVKKRGAAPMKKRATKAKRTIKKRSTKAKRAVVKAAPEAVVRRRSFTSRFEREQH